MTNQKTGRTKGERRKGSERKGQSSKKKTSSCYQGVRRRASIILVCLIVFSAGFALTTDISTVETNAMMPTLSYGDIVLSWSPKFIRYETQPGDIALIDRQSAFGEGSGPNFLRVISSGGETVGYGGDRLTLHGVPLKRFLLTNPAIARPAGSPEIWRETLPNGRRYRIMISDDGLSGDETGEIQLKSDGVFLAGDNRYAAYDSRRTGELRTTQIAGKALFILRSTRDDGWFGHWLKPLQD